MERAIESSSNQSNPEFFWKLYYKIRFGHELDEIYKTTTKPVTVDKELRVILKDFSVEIGWDIEESHEYFTQRLNPHDFRDFLNLYDVSLDALKRRLGNYLLEKIYEIEGNENTEISDFLHAIWDKENPEELIDLRSRRSLIKPVEDIKKEENDVESYKNKKNQSPEQTIRSNEKDMKNQSPEQSIRSKDKEGSPRKKEGKAGLTDESVKQLKEDIESAVSSIKKIDSEFASFMTEKQNISVKKRKGSDSSEDSSNKSEAEKKFAEASFRSKVKDSSESERESAKRKPPAGNQDNMKIRKVQKEDSQSIIRRSTEPKREESPSFQKEANKLAKASSINKILTKQNESFTKDSSKKEQGTRHVKTPSLLMIYQETKDPQDESVYDRQANVLRSTEIYPVYSDLVLKDTWLTKLLEPLTQEIEEIFYSYDHKEEKQVDVRQLKNVFREIIAIAHVEISENNYEDFDKLVNQEFMSSINHSSLSNMQTNKANFSQFMKILQKWSLRNEPEANDLVGKIKRAIKEYENIVNTYGGSSEDTTPVETLIQELKKELEAHVAIKEEKSAKQIADEQRKNITELFQFYSKIQNMMGQAPTFEEINESYTVWTVVKFFKFLTDFNVIGKQEERIRLLSKDQAQQIFKKLANNSRLLSENQFIDALDKLADLYYNNEYDTIYNTSYASLTIPEKRILFYKFLELSNKNALLKKAKGFRLAFSNERGGARIPENDASKHYVFKMSAEKKKQLEEWRKEKQSKSAPQSNIKLRPEPQKNINEIKVTMPTSGYAKRRKAKKIVNGEESMIKAEEEEETVIQQPKIPQQQVLTLQGINGMDYREFDEDGDLKDLITEDNDEYLDQMWGITKKESQPKIQEDIKRFQGIMKMHDEKIAKGMKVLEKARHGYGYAAR
ncbi:unnamed protein product [Blepharisma stoltei]|uniref:EF-hand domain-containing protein n=1 Tax=Blepharisma stoltei TaxID=1481888 RepID=A0AAU9IQ63_9CILI|nr:unnamed protein product [Blepharisma stoltei]